MCSTPPQTTLPAPPGLSNRSIDRKRKSCLDTTNCPTAKRTNLSNHSDDISSIPCYANESGAIKNSTFDVRIIAPTHKGISEAARIMRVRSSSSTVPGIISIPTETHYSLLCFVPFQKPTSASAGTVQGTRRRASDTSKCKLIRLCSPCWTISFYSLSLFCTFIISSKWAQLFRWIQLTHPCIHLCICTILSEHTTL